MMKSALLGNTLRRSIPLVAAVAMAAIVSPAYADGINLVTNGSFTTTSTTVSSEFGSAYAGGTVTVSGWDTGGYNFVFVPGDALANSQFGSDDVGLWGPPPVSPDGGNYVALDGNFGVGALTQTITGLLSGQTYAVSFYFEGAQQSGFTGATTEQLQVSFGSQTQSTPVLNDDSQSYTGWQQYTYDFTATSSSEVLSFLAVGTPDGVPPMSLLDGVSVYTTTPEPSSLALLATGLFGVGGVLRSRFKKIAA